MKLWRTWIGWWTQTETGTVLALFRIALSLVVCVDMLTHLGAGVVDPLYLPVSEGGFAPVNRYWAPWSALFGHSATVSWALAYGIVALSATLAVGFGGRVTAFLLLQAVLWWHALPIDIGGGYDRLTTNGLFVLLIGNSTATLSVDCWLREGRWRSDRPILALARYLGLFQLVVVYVVTGFAKRGPTWEYPYEAVWLALQRWLYMRWVDPPWQGYLYDFTRLGTLVAWYWEVGFLLLGAWFVCHFGWMGPTAKRRADRFDLRWPFLGIGLFTHGMLSVFLNLGTFTAVTFAFYLLALDPPAPRRSSESA